MGHHAIRYHDISCGHRVVGHEGKCRFLHGHNYRVHFVCESLELDDVGRVVDFGEIKSILCEWLERNYDHHFLVWYDDPLKEDLRRLDPSVAVVPYNPTAENMAKHLVENVGPLLLGMKSFRLVKVIVEETAKCSASYEVSK
jgi:6-pyruvoyltetrahydropterin/6-carboxytetrahydropterin synthase